MGIVSYVVILGGAFVFAIGMFKILRGTNLI